MRAVALKINNFRNYSSQALRFGGGVNVVYGANAQGKTNILEAIYLFSLGRSYRTKRIYETVKFGEGFASLELEFVARGTERTACFLIEKKQKRVTIDNVTIEKIGDMIGYFSSVLFTPDHLELIKGGPQKRRQCIDVLISQLRPAYFAALMEYKRIIINKNNLLKKIQYKQNFQDVLFAWNEKLCKTAAIIVKLRHEYIKKISVSAKKIHSLISDNSEELVIQYVCCAGRLIDEQPIEQIEKLLGEKINKHLSRELTLKESIIGTHRDDIEFFINDFSAKSFASQGQCKTAILSFKLAEVEILKETIGESPVLLLDDIMSELDQQRRSFIVENIPDLQTIITCTDDFYVSKAKKFNVKHGTIY